jgi:hypothetical protein
MREQGLAGGGHADLGVPADHRDGRPAGSADRAARTAAAGLSPAAGATGAGAGSVAVSAALRAACGAGVVVMRAMVMTPFLSSGAIPEFTRNFRVNGEDISPFPRKSTPFRPGLANHRANF